MRGFLHRSLVCALLLTLALSSTAWQQCNAAALAPMAPASATDHRHADMHHDRGATASDAHHRHHGAAAHGLRPIVDAVPQPLDEGACQKCCGVCTVASLMPMAPQIAVAISVSTILLSFNCSTYTDRVVLLDPGIPKHLA
jgi:hypothetical protein